MIMKNQTFLSGIKDTTRLDAPFAGEEDLRLQIVLKAFFPISPKNGRGSMTKNLRITVMGHLSGFGGIVQIDMLTIRK